MILRDKVQGTAEPVHNFGQDARAGWTWTDSMRSIRRLARRGGVKRIFALIYKESPRVLEILLEKLSASAFLYPADLICSFQGHPRL